MKDLIKNFFAAVAIDFVETSYTASEGDAPLEVCAVIVSLMGNLDCDLVVTFSELSGTAGMTIPPTFCYYLMVQDELKCGAPYKSAKEGGGHSFESFHI